MALVKLNDVFIDWADEGAIFAQLNHVTEPLFQWASSTNDFEYFGNRSGQKEISPLVENILTKYGTSTIKYDSEANKKLASIVISRYSLKWRKLFSAMTVQYDVLSMSEKMEETPDITKTNNITKNATETPNITKTNNITKNATETPDITKTNNITKNATETPNITTATLNKITTNIEEYSDGSSTGDIYGFNSTSPVPQSDSAANSTRRTIADGENNKTDQTMTEIGTRQNVAEESYTEKETGTRKNAAEESYTEKETGTRTNSEEESHTEKETGKRTTVRTGNNGHTNQSILTEELKLWEWEFLKIVYADMDTLLTCPKY